MPIEYSPSKIDLFFPARRGEFFCDIPAYNDAAMCAEMARLAYCRKEPAFLFDRDTIAKVLEGQGFAAQFFESKGTPDGRGTHCFLARRADSKLAIVAFRGTDAKDPTDLFDDADLLQMDWGPGGKVHTGFSHALAHVVDDLLEALRSVADQMYYTGHSLGAALATLLASLRKPDCLYTIGSPRVGDEDFVRTLAGVNASRYVDCCDLVTRLPPPEVPGCGNYVHYGDLYYIAEDRAIYRDAQDNFVNDDRMSASADYVLKYGWRSVNVAVRELADHAPINYVAALKAA
jgi:pimeloyl-ACP methyl ester carboxylesterase